MKNNATRILSRLAQLALGLSLLMGVVVAQQPSPSPSASPKKAEAKPLDAPIEAGEDAGNYTITSSIELGYRGIRVDGDLNKYRSDLNYKAGPRLFDSSFLVKAKEGKGTVFDTLLLTSTGWGSDPYSNLRINIEKPELYRFDATYRRFKYFRYLNNFVNPNWVFSPASFSVAPNPVTGLHGYNTNTEMGDFDLTLLPKNRTIRFNLGISPERYGGPAFTDYHVGGNEFSLRSQLSSRATDYRVGADGQVGAIDFSFLQGFRRFTDDSLINLGATPGINLNPAVASFTSFNRNEPARGNVKYTRFSAHTLVAKRLDITGRIVYSKATDDLSNLIFVVVNLDPNYKQSGWVDLPLQDFALDPRQPYQMRDLLTGACYLWSGPRNYVELDPQRLVAHIFQVRRHLRTEHDFDYFL